MWMWSLKSPPFLGTISPRLAQSAVHLRTRWLQHRGATQESEAKGAATRQARSSTEGQRTNSSSVANSPRRHRNSRRGPHLLTKSASSSVSGELGSSNGPTNGSDEELAVDLDYAPSLGPFREVLCVLAPILFVVLLYVATGPLHGGSWLAAAGGVLLAAALASLARTIWLEQAYKARERAFAALGDGDSFFRPISTGPTSKPGGGWHSETRSQQLMVHVKVKVGDLAHGDDDMLGAQSGSEAAAGRPGRAGSATARGARAPVPAVHCYHGFGANLGSYKRVQEEMAAVLRGVVTAHDMPGFGLTQRPSDLSSYFLTFNGRLGRLVLDYELQQLGLMPPGGEAGFGPRADRQGAAGCLAAHGASSPAVSAPDSSSLASTVAMSRDPKGSSGDLVVTVGPTKAGAAGSSKPGGKQHQQEKQEQQGATDQVIQQPVQRILIGHSLGGACASLEAVTNPDGISGLVLVAPAVFALPGLEYQNVKLTPERPPRSFPGAPARGSSEPAVASEAEQRRTETARAAAHLGFEPPGTHVTDPPEVRRLYPSGPMPTAVDGGGFTGGTGGGKVMGGGGVSRLGALLSAARSVLVAAASLALLTVLRLLTPVITLLLRSLVRRRTFWMKGLQQAYYNPGAVTGDIVDAYRLPQLVSGWEAGMVNFLLARLTRPSATLGELLQKSAKNLQPTTTSELLASTAAAAAADAKAAAAAAVKPSRDGVREQSSTAITASTTAADPNEKGGAEVAAAKPSNPGEDDGDLASRLAALVTRTGLPVLIIHGLYDRLVPASNSQRLARMLPGCELVLLDRCGHMPQEELPNIFVSLVAEFAARLPVAEAGQAQS